MSTPLDLTAQPTTNPVPTLVPGDPTAGQIRDLAAQLVSMATPSQPALNLSQGIVVDTNLGGTPPTVSITLSGSATQIDSVRFMSGYTPTVGDTVQVLKQDSNVLIMGHTTDIGTPTATTGGWIEPALSSGFTTVGNSNGRLKCRIVTDNGVFKIQWKGSVAHTGTNIVVVSAANMVATGLSLPSDKVSMTTARSADGGMVQVGVDFGTDGSVTLVGANSTSIGATNTTSPVTNLVDTQSTVSHSHGGAVTTATITHDDGSHGHVVDPHSHSLPSSAPTWVSFNGIEYFL